MEAPAPEPFQGLIARTEGRPAPLGKRFAARLIDTAVLGALTAAAAVPLAGRAVDHIDGKIDAARETGETVTVWLLDSTTAALGGALLGVFLVLGVLLDALPTAKWGRTLGKKLCGVDVRDIESHETPASPPRCAGGWCTACWASWSSGSPTCCGAWWTGRGASAGTTRRPGPSSRAESVRRTASPNAPEPLRGPGPRDALPP